MIPAMIAAMPIQIIEVDVDLNIAGHSFLWLSLSSQGDGGGKAQHTRAMQP
jgi:hypothetical protein